MHRLVPPRRGDPSPWGLVQNADVFGPHAVVVSTASHGGVWVAPVVLARILVRFRTTGYSGQGWFEEDCDWCIPYLALGLSRFEGDSGRSERLLAAARDSFRRWHQSDPAAIEASASDPAPAGEVRHG